jgi:hypothetical protein
MTNENKKSALADWVCQKCQNPVSRQVVWQQPTEYRMNYCCVLDGDVIPKENSHD